MTRREWILLILATLMVACAMTFLAVKAFGQSPTPTPIDVSRIDFSQISAADIEATERHRDELRAKAKSALEEQAKVNVDQNKTLAEIKAANEQTRKQFEAYQTAAETQIEKGNKAIVALEHVLKKLHLAKWILCGVWIGFCALVALKIPSIGMYVGGGLAVAGITFIWIWI